MKTKKTILIIALFCISFTSFSQLKVDKYGHVGIGTIYPNVGYQCHIKDNLLITSYPSHPYYELVIRASNPLPEIGSSGDKITFWKTWVGHNKLIAQSFDVDSDSTLKSNIEPIKNGLDKILKIKPYSYNLKDNLIDFKSGDSITNYLKEYGFISQEIKETLKGIDITDTAHGILVMNYDQIIPLTVSAIKEQQLIIDSLKSQLEDLKNTVNSSYNGTVNAENNIRFRETVLYQNKPNPFKEKTTIEYKINEIDFSTASIVIFDMNGALLKSYPINTTGKSQLTINGRDLKPGMYIYTLIVNNKEVDTKRMILLE
jgi:hypothetical protein